MTPTSRTVPQEVKSVDGLNGKTDFGTASALSRHSSNLLKAGPDPRRLEDGQVIAIWDAISVLDSDDRRRLGPKIGREILVNGFEWSASKRDEIAVRPADAYLSATIDASGRDSWASAAEHTRNPLD